jgi:predicted PurR-regulated permease PerM
VSLPGAEPTRPPLPPLLRLLIGAAAVAIIVLGLRSLAPVLTVFMVAIVLAEVLAPVMQWFMRRGLSGAAAAIITVAITLVCGVGLIGLLINSLTRLIQTLPNYQQQLSSLGASLTALLARAHVDTSHLSSMGILDPGRMVGTATSVASRVILTLGRTIFVLLLVAFMLIDLAVRDGRKQGLPGLRWVTQTDNFAGEIRAYMRLTALMAFIGAVANLAWLEVLRVDFAITWGVLAFFVSFIPVVGFVLAMIPPALIALLQYGWDRALLVVVGYVVISFINDNIIRPRLIKHGFEMNFVELFFSLLFWGWVFGPVGTILAVPLTLLVRQVAARYGRPDLAPSVTTG